MDEIPTEDELDRLDQMNHLLIREHELIYGCWPTSRQYSKRRDLMFPFEPEVWFDEEVVECG